MILAEIRIQLRRAIRTPQTEPVVRRQLHARGLTDGEIDSRLEQMRAQLAREEEQYMQAYYQRVGNARPA